MQHAAERSSRSFLARHEEVMAWNTMQCCGTLFLAATWAATQRTMQRNATARHSVAVAQRGLPQHKEACRSMKRFAAAWNFAKTWIALPWHKELCCSMNHGTKNIIAAQKCDAVAWRIWPQHQQQTPAPPGWLFLKFAYCNTISTCAHQPTMQKEKNSYMNSLRNTQ